MPEIIQERVNTDDGLVNLNANKYLLWYYWNFCKNYSNIVTCLQMIDESLSFVLGAAAVADNDYFVIRAVGEGVNAFPWECKFQAADGANYSDPNEPSQDGNDGIFAQLCPAGGWTGAAGVPGIGFAAIPTLLNRLMYEGIGHNCYAYFWANGNRLIAIIDKDQDNSFDDGWTLGKIQGVESPVDDALPAALHTGRPQRAGGAGWDDTGWMLDHTNVPVASVLDPVAYIDPTNQPSKFSGKYVQSCIPVHSTAAGSEVFRGVLDGITAVSSLADKQTLASNYRICFNDISVPWNGSVPI